MNDPRKILIAYDGSAGAEAALNDLRRAGLPDDAEAVLLSVADVFIPPPVAEGEEMPVVPAAVRRAHERAARTLESTRVAAEEAGTHLREMFPRWTVVVQTLADSPAWAVISKTEEWRPDLVVVGSRGHNLLPGRLILGSLSQKVLYEAGCSVRVARESEHDAGAPVRLVIGMDGSADSAAAIEAVAARNWPPGTEVSIVIGMDTVLDLTTGPNEPSIMKWVEADDAEDREWVSKAFEPFAEKLRAAGLNVSIVLRGGKAKNVLIEVAEELDADSIFLGAKGVRGIDRILLGSVSAAVAARATCSVEVVRPAKT